MLVIIGLVVGGVLVGRDLIRAAAVRATISQIEKYNTAARTFYGKYGYLPGDILASPASQFGFAARGTNPGEGDGNGLLEGAYPGVGLGHYGYFEGTGETAMFWVDLSTAGLIDGAFNTATASGIPGNATGTSLTLWFPQAKLGQGNYLYVWSGGVNASTSNNNINYYGISAINTMYTSGISSAPALSVAQAYAIDSKIDDGLPQSGNVTALYLTGTPTWAAGGGGTGANPGAVATGSSSTCYDNGGNSANVMSYSLSQNNGSGVNCALSVQFQ